MKQLIFSFCLMILGASAAQAACFADYKAKQDNPLRLHYGVAEIDGACAVGPATDDLRDRLNEDDWELLNVLGVFDDTGLDERKDSAGEFFLRY